MPPKMRKVQLGFMFRKSPWIPGLVLDTGPAILARVRRTGGDGSGRLGTGPE